MPIPIEMPKLSDTMTEGTLLRWRKKQGDKIEVGDILAEVETDKATMEMEAFDEGVLEKILVSDGTTVPVGTKLAELSGDSSFTVSKAPSSLTTTSQEPPSAISPVSVASPERPTPPPLTSVHARVKASPLAKKLARLLQVDLSRLSGTGPGGRVIARDVQTAPPATPATTGSASLSAPVTPAPTNIPHTKIELSGMRRVIASRLLESKTRIPHFYVQIEVNAEPLMRLRKHLNEIAETNGTPKITVNDFILLATARAAAAHPKVNAAFAENAILQYSSVHLSVAVAVEDGLVTPVIRDAQNLSLRQISTTVKDLANRARNKKLKPEEYQGGTLTVSNLGAYGVENFFAIINPPQAVILAVGAIVKKPVVNAQNEIVVGQRLAISLSCDHRVVDGAVGAEFLATIRKFLEAPESLLF